MAFDAFIGSTGVDEVSRHGLFLHCALFLSDALLADETFFVESLQGQESLSSPFDLKLQLRANTDPCFGRSLNFADIIGRPVTLGINWRGRHQTPRDAAARFRRAVRGGDESSFAFFSGIVADFSMQQPGSYGLTMKPALWKLTLTNRYCVHVHMSVKEVIERVLNRHKVAYDTESLGGADNLASARVQDWLQAGESDYELVQRLMAKAHVFYYINHEATRHTVVFANRPDYPRVPPGDRPLRYTYTNADPLGLHQADVISHYDYKQSLVSTGVSGLYAREENAWENDRLATYKRFPADSPTDPGDLPFHLYKVYQYGWGHNEASDYSDRTARTLRTSSVRLSGASRCEFFRVGHQFETVQPPNPEVNPNPIRPTLEGKKFVLTSVQHQASADGDYHNEFEAAAADGLVTPFSMQDTRQGSVLATVVADGHGERPSGWRYYQKNNFDPEPAPILDNASEPEPYLAAKGVFVRFSTDPSGDPVWVKLAPHMRTAPEIGVMVVVGRAYDDSELPEIQSIVEANGSITVVPGRWIANTQVGSNYSTSYGDSKRVSFGASSRADLDAAVKIISTEYESGQFREASYNQGASYSYSTSEDGRSGILSKSRSFGSTYSDHNGKESKSTSDIDYNYSNQTMREVESYTTINGQSTSFHTVNGNSTSTSNVTGVSTSNSFTGVSGGLNLTGVSGNLSLTGVHSGVNVTGASAAVNVTGASGAVNVTGASAAVNVTGAVATADIVGPGIAYHNRAMTSVELIMGGVTIKIPISLLVM